MKWGNFCRKRQGLSLSVSSQYVMPPGLDSNQGCWELQQLLRRHSTYPCFFFSLANVHFSFMCMDVPACVPLESRRGCWIPWSWVIVSHLLRVLGCELLISGREASACNHLTFFLISQFLLLERDCITPTLFFKGPVTGKSHDSYINFSFKIINVSSVEESQCRVSCP